MNKNKLSSFHDTTVHEFKKHKNKQSLKWFPPDVEWSSLQSRQAVISYLKSKQLLPLGFARQLETGN